ncbi:phage major capsid protein [Agrobacterium cavarae]|uniref:phage major capsid protein n=1 Tax=Agrobacterium cavarae TaxID=2528239 RepID=UPI003D08A3AE
MDYVKHLKEERVKAYEQAKEVLDRAASESRSLDGQERESVDRAFAHMDELKSRESDFRSLKDREDEIAAVTGAHEEARAVSVPVLSEPADDNALIRSLARGERRSVTFESRDITTGTTGAPVPTSFHDQVLAIAKSVGPMLSTSTVLNTSSGEGLEIPAMTAYSTAALVAEAGSIGESDPTLATTTLNAYKYAFLVQVSSELLEDAHVNIVDLLATNCGQAIGIKVNSELTVGDGSSKPNGIVTAATAGVTGGTGVTGKFTYENLVDLVYAADPAARALPGFGLMLATSAIVDARLLQDGASQYIFAPSASDATPDRLLGFPLIENNAMDAVGLDAVSALAGHFPSYYVRQAGGIRLERSDDYAFANGLVTFRCSLRVDGDLPQPSHVKKFAGGAS